MGSTRTVQYSYCSLTNRHALVVAFRSCAVMRRAGVPEDEIPRLHLGVYPLATSFLEPLERLVGPVEEVGLDPATLGLHPCQFNHD
jgi:hypothetical protein